MIVSNTLQPLCMHRPLYPTYRTCGALSWRCSTLQLFALALTVSMNILVIIIMITFNSLNELLHIVGLHWWVTPLNITGRFCTGLSWGWRRNMHCTTKDIENQRHHQGFIWCRIWLLECIEFIQADFTRKKGVCLPSHPWQCNMSFIYTWNKINYCIAGNIGGELNLADWWFE